MGSTRSPRKDSIRLRATLIAAACAIALAGTISTTAAQTTDPTPFTCDKASTSFHVKEARQTIAAAFSKRKWRDRTPAKPQQLAGIDAHRSCLERKKDREKITVYETAKRKAFGLYREYRRVTPFRCQGGAYGYWAIPCAIIACESGFSWSAQNSSSSAAGPYQMLDTWNRPMPANTWARKLTHHRSAAALYAGGAGRSHWVC